MLALPVDAYDSAHETLTGGFKTAAGRNRTVTPSPKIQPIIKKLAQNFRSVFFRAVLRIL